MASRSRTASLPTKIGAVVLLLGCQALRAQTQQEHVHHMGHTVMPFDLAKTLHVFAMDESGGVMRVVARDPGDHEQIAQIREHLRHEAGLFQQGDYTDPSALHGADMPGLKELRAGASGIDVAYRELPDGAAISFRTKDLHLLTAIHRWFGAQLSEHGSDAKAE
jgi:hypothetical protein